MGTDFNHLDYIPSMDKAQADVIAGGYRIAHFINDPWKFNYTTDATACTRDLALSHKPLNAVQRYQILETWNADAARSIARNDTDIGTRIIPAGIREKCSHDWLQNAKCAKTVLAKAYSELHKSQLPKHHKRVGEAQIFRCKPCIHPGATVGRRRRRLRYEAWRALVAS